MCMAKGSRSPTSVQGKLDMGFTINSKTYSTWLKTAVKTGQLVLEMLIPERLIRP